MLLVPFCTTTFSRPLGVDGSGSGVAFFFLSLPSRAVSLRSSPKVASASPGLGITYASSALYCQGMVTIVMRLVGTRLRSPPKS